MSDAGGGDNIWIMNADGSDKKLISTAKGRCTCSYFSPDGKWIYFSSERAAKIPGHAQCFRMRADGTGIEQLTFDARVYWFPHVSPDGQSIVFISYPPGTTGHPPNKDVILRFMRPDGSGQRDIDAFLGGQGTINVNSWAPDSRHLAFVAYPLRKG